METPPHSRILFVLVVNSFISLGDHEISHGEISPGYQENLLVNKFPVFTVRKNIFMLENVQCVALEFLFNPQTLMCVTPL